MHRDSDGRKSCEVYSCVNRVIKYTSEYEGCVKKCVSLMKIQE